MTQILYKFCNTRKIPNIPADLLGDTTGDDILPVAGPVAFSADTMSAAAAAAAGSAADGLGAFSQSDMVAGARIAFSTSH